MKRPRPLPKFTKAQSPRRGPSRLTFASAGWKWSGRWESNISLACGYCLQIKRLRAKWRAACDLRAKNTAMPANASQCDPPRDSEAWRGLFFINDAVQTQR